MWARNPFVAPASRSGSGCRCRDGGRRGSGPRPGRGPRCDRRWCSTRPARCAAANGPRRWRRGSTATGGSRTCASTSWTRVPCRCGRSRSWRPRPAPGPRSCARPPTTSSTGRSRRPAPTPPPAPRPARSAAEPALGPSRALSSRHTVDADATGPNSSAWPRSTARSAIASPPSASITATSTAIRPGSCPEARCRNGSSASDTASDSPVASARSVSSRAPAWPTTPRPSARDNDLRTGASTLHRAGALRLARQILRKIHRCRSEGTSCPRHAQPNGVSESLRLIGRDLNSAELVQTVMKRG